MKSHDAGKRLNNFKRENTNTPTHFQNNALHRVNRISARLPFDHSKLVALREDKQITLMNIVKESYVGNKIIRQPMQILKESGYP